MKLYKCVNCGEPAEALYKTYGPSVLKLTKCVKCKGVVDKYIEYDPVIVMIDLVLISKEAQRHVLYNTEFKSYWKLFIILVMLETYGVWRCDSFFNVAIDYISELQNYDIGNTTHLRSYLNITLPGYWKDSCAAWGREEKEEESDLFIWEKDFYIHFLSTFVGILAFILVVIISMKIVGCFYKLNKVSGSRLSRGVSLSVCGGALSLAALVWATHTQTHSHTYTDTHSHTRSHLHTHAPHLALVFAHNVVAAANVFAVLYECPTIVALVIVLIGNFAKYTTFYHLTPYLREFVS